MTWLALDAAVAVLGLSVLAVLGMSVWHRGRSLMREVRAASERLATAGQTTSPVVHPTSGASDG